MIPRTVPREVRKARFDRGENFLRQRLPWIAPIRRIPRRLSKHPGGAGGASKRRPPGDAQQTRRKRTPVRNVGAVQNLYRWNFLNFLNPPHFILFIKSSKNRILELASAVEVRV